MGGENDIRNKKGEKKGSSKKSGKEERKISKLSSSAQRGRKKEKYIFIPAHDQAKEGREGFNFSFSLSAERRKKKRLCLGRGRKKRRGSRKEITPTKR